MRKHIFLLLIVILSAGVMHAGSRKKLDSLLRVLSIQKDTSRINTLIKLSQAYYGRNEDSALFYAKMLTREAAKAANHDRLSDGYTIVGSCYYHLDQTDSAFFYKWKAIQEAEFKNYSKGKANAYNDIGLYFRDEGDLDSALKYILIGADLREQLNEEKQLGVSYLNLGLLLVAMNNGDKGLSYLQKSEAIFTKFGPPKNLATVLNNIAAVYDDRKQYDTALIIYQHSLTIRDSLGDKDGQSQSMINIGVLYRNMGDYKNAEDLLQKAYKLKIELQDNNGLAICLLDLGQTKRLEKDFKAAETLLLRADSVNQFNNSKELKRDLFLEFSRLYSDMKEYDLALHYMEMYQSIKDSIFGEKNMKTIADMQTKYESAKKEKENLVLKADAKERELALEKERSQKIFLYSGIGVLLIILLFALYAFLSKRKSNKLLEGKNEQITRQNSTLKDLNKKLIDSEEELTALNASKDKLFSIISHDLSNPVKAISNYNQAVISQKDKMSKEQLSESFEKLNRSIEPLQGFLDNLLYWSLLQREGVNVKKETFALIDILWENVLLYDSYCALKKIRIDSGCPNDLMVSTDKNMLRLVVRNLLNNAIKFSPEYSTVHLKASSGNGIVAIHISDNGNGIPADKLALLNSGRSITSEKGTAGESGTGLGLNLVKEFIAKMEGSFEIESSSHGTTFHITIPVV